MSHSHEDITSVTEPITVAGLWIDEEVDPVEMELHIRRWQQRAAFMEEQLGKDSNERDRNGPDSGDEGQPPADTANR